MVLAGFVVYVIVLTFGTGYITQSTRNIICNATSTQTKDDETMTNNCGDYIVNCANIDSIKLVRLLGSGYHKKTYLGEYGPGTKVAVKMVNTSPSGRPDDDHIKMFLKEILFLQELKHHNILKLLGFCIRGGKFSNESLKGEGALAVYEYGEEVHRNTSFFKNMPLSQRLDIALAIIDLFIYLENSPLGSMAMFDTGIHHFLWNNNTLKMIDLTGNWQEPSCQSRDNARCEFNLTCVDGFCVGYNAKSNMVEVRKLLYQRLLTNVDILALERNATANDMRQRRCGLDALKQLMFMLSENGKAQRFTFTWVRQRLLDVRSAL